MRKEAFTDLQQMIDSTALLSDLELQAYLSQLSPDQRTQFIGSQVANAVSSVSTSKEHKYIDLADQIKGVDTNIGSAMYYLARTKDLQNLAKDADKITKDQLNVIDVNENLSLRQNEVNEWSNQNKLDTLFFLQVMFVGLCFMAVLLFLSMNGIIPSYLFKMFSVIVTILIILTLILRARFTSVARDSRYWHKSRFPKQPDVVPGSNSSNCPSS